MILTTPSEALNQTAEIMREQRIENRLTQEDLAQKSGVALSTLRKFERTGAISLEGLFKLAIVLGMLEKILKALETQKKYSSIDDILKQDKNHKSQRVRRRKI